MYSNYLKEVLVPPVKLRDGDGQVLQAWALVLGELRVARPHVLVLALFPDLVIDFFSVNFLVRNYRFPKRCTCTGCPKVSVST